jgi:hypothetical protein
LEKHERNKLEQEVVHEQAMTLVKLSQKEPTTKQNEQKAKGNTKKERHAKETKGVRKIMKLYKNDVTVSNMKGGGSESGEGKASKVSK